MRTYYTVCTDAMADRWITGNWGEDAEKEPEPEFERDGDEEREWRRELGW